MKIQLGYDDGGMLFNPYMLGFDQNKKINSDKYRNFMAIISATRQILDECGISSKCKGYLYMTDCVIAIFDHRNLNINFKSDVYPYIAIKYGIKNAATVEHGIRNAIFSAYEKNEAGSGQHSVFMSRFTKRPTSKEFVLLLTREVYRMVWNESVEFARY